MNENTIFFFYQLILSLLLAPLLPGIINRVKAIFAGRHGRPLLQTYYDIWKLLHKSEIICACSSWVFIISPAIVMASAILALLFIPQGGTASPLGFTGDFIFVAYLFGIGRFALISGALDTGSAFEGMGASREATFSALAEPAIILGFLILSSVCLDSHGINSLSSEKGLSLNSMFNGQSALAWQLKRPELILPPIIFFILLLAENCRIPVDDPNTHLELTMIHEVMVLDQSGPNLAMITYGSAIKLWFFACLVADLLIPPLSGWLASVVWVLIIMVIGILVGIVESIMARLRLLNVPRLLGMASVLATFALILTQAR